MEQLAKNISEKILSDTIAHILGRLLLNACGYPGIECGKEIDCFIEMYRTFGKVKTLETFYMVR